MSSQRDAYTSFSIGGILVDTFEVIGNNVAMFVSIALLGQFPAIIFNLLLAGVHASGTEFRVSFGYLINLRTTPGAIEALVALGSFSVAQGALVFGAIAALSGQRTTLAVSLTAACKSALPLLAITILSTLGIIVGFVMLIVPGVILALGWIAVVPACVIERKSTFESFRRSWTMTKGHRLAIFGVMVVAVVGTGVLLLVIMLLSGSLALAAGGNSGAAILWIMSLFAGCVVSVFSGTLLGVIYHELYFIREGHAPVVPSSVFDQYAATR
jgi:hypothetical protein